MDRNKELEIVTTAYFLEDRLSSLKSERRQLVASKPVSPLPPEKPQEMKKTVAKKPYPPINPTVTVDAPPCWKPGVYIAGAGVVLILISIFFSLIFLEIVGIFCFPAAIVITVINFVKKQSLKSSKRQEEIERIKNSSEYLEECRKIDEENRLNQERADTEAHQKYLSELKTYENNNRQYEHQLDEYNNTLIPDWTEELEKLDEVIANTQAALDEVYSTNIIPITYRNLASLSFLAPYLNTSQYNLKEAIDDYNAQVLQCQQRQMINLQQAQVEVSRSILSNQQYSNWLQEESLDIAQNSNDTLRSMDTWQKADILTREYRRMKARKKRK